MIRDQDAAEEQANLLSPEWKKPSPDTITSALARGSSTSSSENVQLNVLAELVRRLRALTLRLLPHEVNVKTINDPANRIITPRVLLAYREAAGDFTDALPYCLLRAQSKFLHDSQRNPANHGENFCRAVACEILAHRIVHQTSPDKIVPVITTRYRYRQHDGELSSATSALEIAVDNHCTIFLSSCEVQNVVTSLWGGNLVQTIDDHDDIQYLPYHKSHREDFWSHLDSSRMSVPRYQNVFRTIVWFIFLAVYSQAVREPTERLNSTLASADPWEHVLYIMALAFCIEDIHRGYKLIHYATRRTFGFWSVIAFITNTLLLIAFIFRVVSLAVEEHLASDFRLRSFQVLSFVAPFIWMKLVTIFDGYKYIGTMQICVSRMLQESGIFFSLLCLLGAGFLQAMYALDAADGQVPNVSTVVNVLLQGLLQSPNYTRFKDNPAGLMLYYLWNLATVVILLNILVSLFASAYAEVVGDADAEYMAFFAWKTIAMIRAPDSYVYPAPFNLIELFLIAPMEYCGLTAKQYAKLNRAVMTIIFFIPLSTISFFETSLMRSSWVIHWLNGDEELDLGNPRTIDPAVEGPEAEHGLQISKVPFSELARKLPNTAQSTEATVLKELSDIQESLHILMEQVRQLRG